MKYLGVAGGVAFTAIMIFGAVILYKKAFGKCGCTAVPATPAGVPVTKLATVPTLDRSLTTSYFGGKKDMVS